MGAKEKELLPEYPALARCIVVESRFSSRHEIVKDIKASALFEEIVEAGSIDNALEVIKVEDIDACFIGRAVSHERAEEFVREASSFGHAADCAFIAVVDKGTEFGAILLSAGVHAIVDWPCSKKEFTDRVIEGVIKANKNTIWHSIFLERQRIEENALGSLGKGAPNKKKPVKLAATMSWEERLENLPQILDEELRNFADEIERGLHALDAKGAPTSKSLQAIREVVERVVGPRGVNAERREEIAVLLRRTIHQWFLDFRLMTYEQASAKLLESVDDYLEGTEDK